jgi:hypothetical protein
VESPSSFYSLHNHQNPLFFLCLCTLLSSRSRTLLLRPSLSQGCTYNPISHTPRRIPHQRITWQYPLPSIVTSHASALLANTHYSCISHQHIVCQYPLLPIVISCASTLLDNTHSTQLLCLVPADFLPYPCPPQFSSHPPARYLTTGRTPSHSFALLVSIVPYQSQSYSVCYCCRVDIRSL